MKRLLAAISLFTMGLVLTPSLVAQTTLVNHLTMNQWVRSTEGGALKGRVILPNVNGEVEAAKDVNVAILSRDGEVLRAKTGANGEFAIQGVEPGVYALTARGNSVFACCALHVIDSGNGVEGKFPDVAEVSLANVDYTIVNTALIRYLPPIVRPVDVSISGAELDALASQVCGSDLFRVAQSKGGMKGRLYFAGAIGPALQGANMTNVFLFNDNMQIDRTLTDDSGRFAFETLQAGRYSLLAVGPAGIGLMGFELVDQGELSKSVQNVSSENGQFVGLGHGGGPCCQEFTMQVAPMPEIINCVEEVATVETIVDDGCPGCDIGPEVAMDECCTPVAGGGVVSSGYGGGGGGGGGGFGGGALIGLAGLAGLAAIGNDNNNAIIPPIVASPAIP